MESLNKFSTDFNKGKDVREAAATFLNEFLPDSFRMERIHPLLRTMSLPDKAKYNKSDNRLTPSSFLKAMGLDYWLIKEDKSNRVPIRLFASNSVFLKLPRDFKDNPNGWLDLLIAWDYHFMILDLKNERSSFPISIKIFITNWRPKMAMSKGNKNRLDFQGPASKIGMDSLTQKNALGDSVIFEKEHGNCLTKKKANSRLLSYHFLVEGGISKEQLKTYCEKGRLNPAKK